ncbi:unnamed protein product [Didymodactylos carnosus]|uniref:Uncharacterized protein n=1 Tax=Didymodactylos carnosus TaxID=1234261 RepID=A0A8S2FY78_9BILA|nr:unnamed protein product [Didymodactylos carnosus]CAF4389260.1 unnamed protein product [Didymodactylos carnosus]
MEFQGTQITGNSPYTADVYRCTLPYTVVYDHIQRQEIGNLESYMLPLRQRLNSEECLLEQIELKFDNVKQKLLQQQRSFCE